MLSPLSGLSASSRREGHASWVVREAALPCDVAPNAGSLERMPSCARTGEILCAWWCAHRLGWTKKVRVAIRGRSAVNIGIARDFVKALKGQTGTLETEAGRVE